MINNLKILFLEKCDSPDGYPFTCDKFISQMNGSENALRVLQDLSRHKYIDRSNTYMRDGNKSGGYHFMVRGIKITPDGKRWLQMHRKH